MILPTRSTVDEVLCPAKLIPRSFTSDVASTAESFKSWDTCMDNKTCKIVAIVGICLAAIVAIWIVGGLIRCLCYGIRGIGELFCCCLFCCRRRDKQNGAPAYYDRELNDMPKQSAYNNPHMYPPKAQQAYDSTNWNRNTGYTPVEQQQNQIHYGSGVISDEPEKYDYYNQNTAYNNNTYRGGYK